MGYKLLEERKKKKVNKTYQGDIFNMSNAYLNDALSFFIAEWTRVQTKYIIRDNHRNSTLFSPILDVSLVFWTMSVLKE